jgi:hypothetical protein
MDDRQTDAAGLAGGGELSLFVPVHDDCLSKAVFQLLTLGVRIGQLLAQTSEFLLAGAEIESADDGVGLAIEGLAGDAAPSRVLANSAVGTVEDNGGAGQARRWQ